MPIFIQTDSKVIDVEKITFIDTHEHEPSTIYFTDGQQLALNAPEMDTLLCSMLEAMTHPLRLQRRRR